MICEKCGVENAERFKFCTGCGASLNASQPEEPAAAFLSESVSETGFLRRNLEEAELLVGHTLDGKYRLNSVIEAAGTSATYNAVRLKIGDEVIVKIFKPEVGLDSELADRFTREAQFAALFKHPNAAAIYDFDQSEDKFFYVVMELAAGESLRRIIKQQEMLPVQTVSAIVGQVCEALDEAHRQGIVHRDIKPENILVSATSNNFRVKVFDFGLAEMNSFGISDSAQANSAAGTPRYMSPEQCLGEEIDGRSDIYSFGVVLYEMLTGAAPFDAPTTTAIAVQQVTKKPVAPRSLNPNISPSVEAIVMRSLEKQREMRQQTAADLARELHNAVFGISDASQSFSSAAFNSPTVNAADNLTSVNSQTDYSTPIPVKRATAATPHYDPVNERSGVPSFGPNYAERKGNASKFLLIGGITLALLLLSVVGAIIWRQTQKSDGQPVGDNHNAQVKTVSNPTSDSNFNSSDANLSTVSSADEEFTRIQTKFGGAAERKSPAFEREIKDAESKFPEDYRFTYQKVKIEAAASKSHHEAFEILFGAGEKAIKSGKSAEFLSDLQKDGNMDLKRLTAHKEWTVLENALRRNDSKALEVKEH